MLKDKGYINSSNVVLIRVCNKHNNSYKYPQSLPSLPVSRQYHFQMVYWDILGYTGIYWGILGYTGVYWALPPTRGGGNRGSLPLAPSVREPPNKIRFISHIPV